MNFMKEIPRVDRRRLGLNEGTVCIDKFRPERMNTELEQTGYLGNGPGISECHQKHNEVFQGSLIGIGPDVD